MPRKQPNLHKIADSFVHRFAGTFELSAKRLQGRITLGAVETDMARGIRSHPKTLYALVDEMVIAKAPTQETVPAYEDLILAVAQANNVVMDLDSPFVLDAAKKLTADLVTNVNKETKAAIRQMIFEAIRDGDAPIEAQKVIRQVVGLTKRDAMTVKRLMALDPSRASRKAAQLVRRRAINIARTETMRASNLGQKATWQHMVQEGLLDPATTRQVWIVTDDDRLCPDCAPMEGLAVDLDEDFAQTERGVLPSERTPYDGEVVEAPPLHPSCRCTTALEFDD